MPGYTKKIRTIGGDKEDNSGRFTDEALFIIIGSALAAAKARVGIYIGPQASSGSVRIKLYAGDDPAQCYIECRRPNGNLLASILEEIDNGESSVGSITKDIGRLLESRSKPSKPVKPIPGIPEEDLPA